MIAAGVRIYACELYPISMAKSLRPQEEGGVLITNGPYLEAKEYIGGFWILETADMDQAVARAPKGSSPPVGVSRCERFFSSQHQSRPTSVSGMGG